MEPLKKVERLQQIGTLMAEHGRHAIIALAIIILGLITVKWLNQNLGGEIPDKHYEKVK